MVAGKTEKSDPFEAEEDFCYFRSDEPGIHSLIQIDSVTASFNGYIQLNKTASALWERLQEPSSFEELVQFLQETYDLSREHAAKDAEDFLKKLQEHDMVVMC